MSPTAGPSATLAPLGHVLVGIPPSLRIGAGPLDSYLLTPQDNSTLRYAEALLVASCMKDRGFSYSVPRYADLLAYVTDIMELPASRVYGLVNLADAKRYGFGDPPTAPNPGAQALTPAAMKALIGPLTSASPGPGTPGMTTTQVPEGCAHLAEDRLGGVANRPVLESPLAEQLLRDSGLRAQGTAPYLKVQQDWADCMKARGYDIPDPVQPGLSPAYKQALRPHLAGTPAGKPEVELAVTDVTCAVKVNLVQRLNAQVSAIAATLLEQNALALAEQRKVIEHAITAALKFTNGNADGAPS